MVSCAGAVKTVHQPLWLLSVLLRSEERNSPIVGTSQNMRDDDEDDVDDALAEEVEDAPGDACAWP